MIEFRSKKAMLGWARENGLLVENDAEDKVGGRYRYTVTKPNGDHVHVGLSATKEACAAIHTAALEVHCERLESMVMARENDSSHLGQPGPDAQEVSADSLSEIYGAWGEHPDFPRDDWQYEVANGDTRRGYWDWVVARIDEDETASDEEE